MGLFPQYDVPNIEMTSEIGPNHSVLTLYVGNYKGFIDSLLSIKEGGQKTFKKYTPGGTLTLKIVNAEAGKILEEP